MHNQLSDRDLSTGLDAGDGFNRPVLSNQKAMAENQAGSLQRELGLDTGEGFEWLLLSISLAVQSGGGWCEILILVEVPI